MAERVGFAPSCRREVVVVAGLLWISWCVLVRRDFVLFCFRFLFFFERRRPDEGTRPLCLICLSTGVHVLLMLIGQYSV